MRNLSSLILLLIIIGFISCNNKQSNSITPTVEDTRINNYLKACQANGFNGSVLIVRNDSIILNKGFGLANKEDSIPNTSKTIFDICSVTKQFTAAAVLKLVEEGKLNLSDSLGMYFKAIPSDKRGITIHQLLTHSAGFDHDIGNGDFDPIPQDEYFKELFDTDLLFHPGEKYSYSNSGYSILGRIIELVSDKSYEAYLQEKLFEPSGMKQTGYLLPKWNKKFVANEYLYNVINKGNHIAQYMQDGKIAWPLKANGGINSTQEDMYKWYLSLKNNTVLNEASVEKLTTPYIPEDEDESGFYAYGWTIFQSDRNSKVISHNGFNGISYYDFSWFPHENALILFVTNTSTRETARISYELEKMLFDVNYSAEPILKNNVSQLLTFTENYSGDPGLLGEKLLSKHLNLLNNPIVLNKLSGIYLREKQINKALEIATINTQLFPTDGNIWDTMGDIYLENNQKQKAKESYKKALELKPESEDCYWCENSRKQLDKLN